MLFSQRLAFTRVAQPGCGTPKYLSWASNGHLEMSSFFKIMCTSEFRRCRLERSLEEVARSRSRHLCGAGSPFPVEFASQAQALRPWRSSHWASVLQCGGVGASCSCATLGPWVVKARLPPSVSVRSAHSGGSQGTLLGSSARQQRQRHVGG